MSTLTDLITWGLLRHQRIPTLEGPGRHRCTGCDHLQNETDGANSPRVEAHRAEIAAALVADWLADVVPTVLNTFTTTLADYEMGVATTALAAEARKGADQ